MTSSDTLVAELSKNSTEMLRISLGTFNGHHLVHLRVWYRPKDGSEPCPGKSGLSLRVAMLPALHAALSDAIAAVEGQVGSQP